MAKEKLFGWAFMVMMMAMSFSACSEGAEEVPDQETEIKLDCKVKFDDEVITSVYYSVTQAVPSGCTNFAAVVLMPQLVVV